MRGALDQFCRARAETERPLGSAGKDLFKHFWTILPDHFRGEPVLLADGRIQVCARTFGPLLSFGIQFPQSESLGPGTLPFEVIHQRPVEVALDGPIKVDSPPHLMNVLCQIARANVVIPAIYAGFS